MIFKRKILFLFFVKYCSMQKIGKNQPGIFIVGQQLETTISKKWCF